MLGLGGTKSRAHCWMGGCPHFALCTSLCTGRVCKMYWQCLVHNFALHSVHIPQTQKRVQIQKKRAESCYWKLVFWSDHSAWWLAESGPQDQSSLSDEAKEVQIINAAPALQPLYQITLALNNCYQFVYTNILNFSLLSCYLVKCCPFGGISAQHTWDQALALPAEKKLVCSLGLWFS